MTDLTANNGDTSIRVEVSSAVPVTVEQAGAGNITVFCDAIGSPGRDAVGGGQQQQVDVEIVAAADGTQTIDLPSAPKGIVALHINGLLQRRSAYVVAGQTVTVPATMNIIAGDTVIIEFIV